MINQDAAKDQRDKLILGFELDEYRVVWEDMKKFWIFKFKCFFIVMGLNLFRLFYMLDFQILIFEVVQIA